MNRAVLNRIKGQIYFSDCSRKRLGITDGSQAYQTALEQAAPTPLGFDQNRTSTDPVYITMVLVPWIKPLARAR